MRIISQDGKVDLPYELTKLQIEARPKVLGGTESIFRIQGYFVSNTDWELLAEYSTNKKAEKALWMLRDKYSTLRVQEVIDKDVNVMVLETHSQEQMEEYFTASFQFPTDDEVEV